MSTSSSGVGGHRQHDSVEPPAQCGGELVDAAVPVVGGGNDVESLARLNRLVELGYGQHLLRQDRDERVLHVGRHPGQLLHPGDAPLGHGAEDRTRYQCVPRRPVGQQTRVVPAVPDRLLWRAGCALHQQRGVAGDGGAEMLGDPGLGGAGDAEQQQRPVGGQGRYRHLDEPARADVLGRDGVAVAEQVGHDGLRRHPPARRARAVVVGGEPGQLRRVEGLGMRAQHRCDLRWPRRPTQGRRRTRGHSHAWWLGHGISPVLSVSSDVSVVISAVMVNRSHSALGCHCELGRHVAAVREQTGQVLQGGEAALLRVRGPRLLGQGLRGWGEPRRQPDRGQAAQLVQVAGQLVAARERGDAADDGLPQRVRPGRRAGDKQGSPRRAHTLRQRRDRPLG